MEERQPYIKIEPHRWDLKINSQQTQKNFCPLWGMVMIKKLSGNFNQGIKGYQECYGTGRIYILPFQSPISLRV